MTTGARGFQGRDLLRRPASQGTRTTSGMADFNLIAVFPDMDSARHAINTLGRAGIEADDISLTGAAADAAANEEETAEADAAAMKHFVAGVGIGAVMGIIAGIVLGAPITLAVLKIIDLEITVASVIAGLALSALTCGIIGALLGHYYPANQAQPWELSFHRTTGGVRLGVHASEFQDTERARKALESQHPLDLYYLDSEGRRV